MSSTIYAASITPASSSALYFNIARTDGGRILDRTNADYEELNTPGVDGRRWRLVRRYFPDFTIETYADFTTYTNAITEARAYDAAIGKFCSLSWAAGGFTGAYANVKIIECKHRVTAGFFGGFGATTGATAFIRAEWKLACQQQET